MHDLHDVTLATDHDATARAIIAPILARHGRAAAIDALVVWATTRPAWPATEHDATGRVLAASRLLRSL